MSVSSFDIIRGQVWNVTKGVLNKTITSILFKAALSVLFKTETLDHSRVSNQ